MRSVRRGGDSSEGVLLFLVMVSGVVVVGSPFEGLGVKLFGGRGGVVL